MLKTFNKIMYYFGYAPIRISHEVKYHIVPQMLDFELIKNEVYLDSFQTHILNQENINWIKERHKEDLELKLFNDIKKHINIIVENDELRRMTVFKSEIYIGKIRK